MNLPLELGQVSDPTARRALEQISLQWPARVVWGDGLIITDIGGGVIRIDVDASGAFAFFNG
jgi:hypothetical protein